MQEYTTLKQIVEQLEFCNYQTKDELHDLENNVAFIKLKEIAENISVPLDALVMLQKRKPFTPKFDKGERVWYMKNNRPTEVIISAIEIFYVDTNQDHIKYNATDVISPVTWLDHTNLFEDMLYKTKEELLKTL